MTSEKMKQYFDEMKAELERLMDVVGDLDADIIESLLRKIDNELEKEL